jgi:hypothetical protein
MGTVTAAAPESFSLLGSSGDEAVAMFVKVVPSGVAEGMWATNVKSALDPGVSVAMVQVIVPLLGTPGSVQTKVGPLF